MVTGEKFAERAVNGGYIGIPYKKLDCQGFVEKVLADCGVRKSNGTVYNWRGSNAMYRNYYSWRGTVKECIAKFGMIPQGALVYTRKDDGGEVEKGYHDGLGNFSHVGIYVGEPHGVVHSTTGGVQFGKFPDAKRWTNVSLLDMIDYTAQNGDNKDMENAKWLIDSIRGLLDKLERMIVK